MQPKERRRYAKVRNMFCFDCFTAISAFAFGAAGGEAKEYFLSLERTTEAAADARCGIAGYIDFVDPSPFIAVNVRRLLFYDHYLRPLLSGPAGLEAKR